MKGKAPKTGKMNLSAYAGGNSSVASEMKKGTAGFKRGGKTVDKADGPMSAAHAGRKPRQSGGGVFSSAKAGTPRSKAQNC